MGLAGKVFERLGDLNRGGEIYGSGKDAGGVAGFYGAAGGLGEDAGQAGGGRRAGGGWWLRVSLRQDVHRGGVGPDGGGVDPGFGLLDGEVVDEIAGFEVVGGVVDDVGGG